MKIRKIDFRKPAIIDGLFAQKEGLDSRKPIQAKIDANKMKNRKIDFRKPAIIDGLFAPKNGLASRKPIQNSTKNQNKIDARKSDEKTRIRRPKRVF